MREDHPQVDDFTLSRYTSCQHLLVAPRGTPRGYVDAKLDEKGRGRRVKRTVSSFLSAPFLVETSDVIITMPRRVARRVARLLDVVLLAPPLELGSFDVDLVWHRRHAEDPAHRWLRTQVVETADEMPSLRDLRTE